MRQQTLNFDLSLQHLKYFHWRIEINCIYILTVPSSVVSHKMCRLV